MSNTRYINTDRTITVEGGHTLDLSEYTHFAPSCSMPAGWYDCIILEKCPRCGETIYNDAKSTPHLKAPASLFIGMGLKMLDKLPPNLEVDFHDGEDADEEWGCEKCF